MNKKKSVNSSPKKPREGWEEAFRKMAENGDDELLDKEALYKQSSWDDKEWVW